MVHYRTSVSSAWTTRTSRRQVRKENQMAGHRLNACDVVDTADSLVRQLRPAAKRDWSDPAGKLSWTVRDVIDHLVDVAGFYSIHLAAGSAARLRVDVRPHPTATNDQRLDAVAASHRLLAVTIDAADARTTAWHLAGRTDATGFAGLACNELLVHGWDAAQGLRLPWHADEELCRQVLTQRFPAVTPHGSHWPTLLAANGR